MVRFLDFDVAVIEIGGFKDETNSLSRIAAEESFLNRSNHEDNYYSFYPSNNEEDKIRSAHRFLINVRDNELALPEGNYLKNHI
jgi:hypothetical protein